MLLLCGQPGFESGDVLVALEMKPHEVFERKENDLAMVKTIKLVEVCVCVRVYVCSVFSCWSCVFVVACRHSAGSSSRSSTWTDATYSSTAPAT